MKKRRNAAWTDNWKLWRKMLMFMKLLSVLLFGVCMSLHASVLSQHVKIVIDLKNVPLTTVFEELGKQSKCDFFYNYALVQKKGTVNVTARNKELETVLEELLPGLGLTFSFDGNIVVIKEKLGEQAHKTIKVRGWVHDIKKLPMPGVTIQVVGTTLGTSTNQSGWFSMELPMLKGALEFSFVGYKKRRVEFFEKSDTLRIVMEEDLQDLDEVVVRAYGTQNKREMVSAISTVKSEEMKELPAASITSMLQGRLAGVNIIQQSGAPGSAAVIAVRGFNSLLVNGASDGQPLWVVDGVPMHSFVSPVTGTNTLADLDPSMIESIQVLKDAAAASIYGSRAGNGVILITTKKGQEGRTKFAGNVSYTASQLMEWPTQTGGRMERWLDLSRMRNQRRAYDDWDYGMIYPSSYEDVYRTWDGIYDAFWGNGEREGSINYGLQDSLDPYYNNVQNWWKYLFNTGKVVNANIQASGGTDRLQYMVGVGYYDEKGIMVNSAYSRLSLRSNLTAQLTNRLRIDTRIYLSYVDRSMNKSGSSSRYEGMQAVPNIQTTYIAADPKMLEEWLKNIKQVKDRTDDYRGMASVFLEYNLLKGLNFSASGNVDYSQANMNKFTPSSFDAQYHENKSENVINRVISISTEELLRYHVDFGDKHNFDMLLGINANKEQNFYTGGEGRGGASDDVYFYDPRKNPSVVNHGKKGTDDWVSMTTFKSNFTEKILVSYFGRLGYNYKQRYLLEFTFRRDGSSTFGEGNRWANFPSIALGWAFSEETFIKRFTGKWLNWGKIRGSYGTSGQTFTDAYLAHGLMRARQDDFFMGNSVIETATPVSPDLTWEKTEQYDLGLDMDMFDYRVNLKLDYYYKYTSSLIYDVVLPGALYRQESRVENAMAVSNEGLELELQADILRGSKWSWRTRLNAAKNWNRFEKSYTGKDMGGLVIGRPLYGMYVFAGDGIYESEDEVPRYYQLNGSDKFLGGNSTINGVSGLVGSYKLKDLNGDGVVNDLYFAGSPLPLVHGGWVNELRWGDFDLNMLINYSFGRKILNKRMASLSDSGPKFLDYRKVHFWNQPGDKTDLPRIGASTSADIDRNIEKVNVMSLKQLTIGYNLPDAIARRVGFSGVRFFATGENLFYWSNYSGENPEVVDIYTGKDMGTSYPLPRKWTLGLTLNF